MTLKKTALVCLLGLMLSSHLFSQAPSRPLPFDYDEYLVRILAVEDTFEHLVVQDCRLFTDNWDTLAQPIFWQRIMNLPKDISLVNIARTRKVLGQVPTTRIDSMGEKELLAYKDSVRDAHKLDKEEEIYVTHGRDYFYQFDKVMPAISKAIPVFLEEGVDPFLAQSILLIESPGQIATSPAGAHGSFQLMKRVAIEQGLVVNDTLDEREDFEKAAGAAARLLKKVCIPRTKMILDARGLIYDEEDIWFRLMVLHVYHAGYRNVRGVVNKIAPKKGNMSLIQTLWRTEYRRFGNSSQNYSQLVLASLFELNRIIFEEYDIACY